MRLTIFLLLSIPFSLFSQMNCRNSWNNPALEELQKTYFQSDTAAARLHLSSARVVLLRDTLSAGISPRNTNDPNCYDCMLFRFDSRGRAEYIYDNTARGENPQGHLDQFVYDDQNREKYALYSAKDWSNEYDTAWHLKSFCLVDYTYANTKISKGYSAYETGFSTTPKNPPLWTMVENFDKKGRLVGYHPLLKHSEMNDSMSFVYDTEDSLLLRYYLDNVFYRFTSYTYSNNRIATSVDSTQDGKVVSYFSYDSRSRLVSITTSSNEILSRSNIRYNKEGLPELLVMRTSVGLCALGFYYTYSQ